MLFKTKISAWLKELDLLGLESEHDLLILGNEINCWERLIESDDDTQVVE